jgi:hypothetical protein
MAVIIKRGVVRVTRMKGDGGANELRFVQEDTKASTKRGLRVLVVLGITGGKQQQKKMLVRRQESACGHY